MLVKITKIMSKILYSPVKINCCLKQKRGVLQRVEFFFFAALTNLIPVIVSHTDETRKPINVISLAYRFHQHSSTDIYYLLLKHKIKERFFLPQSIDTLHKQISLDLLNNVHHDDDEHNISQKKCSSNICGQMDSRKIYAGVTFFQCKI